MSISANRRKYRKRAGDRNRANVKGSRRNVAGTASGWAIRRYREGNLGGRAYIAFAFPTEGGGRGDLRVSHSLLRHPKDLLDEFADHLAIFPSELPTDDKTRTEFLRALVSADTGPIEWVPNRTGFHDKTTFVTRNEIVRADGKTNARLCKVDGEDQLNQKGTKRGERRGVLKLARRSTYLAFGIGVALAAPLPSYVRLWREADDDGGTLLTETAVFNFSGASSSGKSSVCMAALSIAGAPDNLGTLDFTRRGLAEMADDNNDLPLVTDDSEKAEDTQGVLVRSLKALVHMIPSGRYKAVARGTAGVPALTWSTFGLSNSPELISVLAAKHNWKMSPGDKVRLFDIAVPGPKDGGIFDRISGDGSVRASKSVVLIKDLQQAFSNHCGNTFPLWIQFLLSKSRSTRVLELTERFVERVGANTNGWETRFARKFGVVYAAMRLGVESGLLPWKNKLPLKIATKCYRLARSAAQVEDNREDGRLFLQRIMSNPQRYIVRASKDGGVTRIKHDTIAVQYAKSGCKLLGLLDDALVRGLGTRGAKSGFIKELAQAKLVHTGHGHAGTVQERLPLRRNHRTIARPRLWVIDRAKLATYLKRPPK